MICISSKMYGCVELTRGAEAFPGVPWLGCVCDSKTKQPRRFHSEPHLPGSPAPVCFPRTCFNFSRMKHGCKETSFLGAAFWHYNSGLSASRQSQQQGRQGHKGSSYSCTIKPQTCQALELSLFPCLLSQALPGLLWSNSSPRQVGRLSQLPASG